MSAARSVSPCVRFSCFFRAGCKKLIWRTDGKEKEGKENGKASLVFPPLLLLIASLTSKTQQYKGEKDFVFFFFLKENVASASVLVVALVTHSLGSYSHAAAAAEVNLTPEKISCFFTKLISRTERKWEEEVGGLKRLSPPYGQLRKSTEGIVSRIIGWKKKRALFQDRREGEKATEGGGGEKD